MSVSSSVSPAVGSRSGPNETPPTAGRRRNGGTATAYLVMLGGYPLAWAAGLTPVFFPAVAVFMALWLIKNRPLRIPKGTILYVLFLLIVGASVIQVNSAGRLAIYALRASWYAAALVTVLYLFQQRGPEARVTMIRAMVALWMFVVLGGYLSMIVPELQWSTPLAKLLPGLIANNDFVQDLINPRVSEIQVFRYAGITLYRPAAPFAYTNGWGSTMALLTPFVLAAMQERRVGIPRPALVLMLAAAVVPFYLALNRGSWLTLGIGLVYGAIRYSITNRNSTPIKVLAAAGVLGVVLISTTGVLTSATESLETRSADSNETRSQIYIQTIERTAESPLIGYGTTRPNPANPSGPPLGTHGQLWAVLFAHGYLAMILYVLFFGLAFIRSKPVDPLAHWANVALLIGLLQLPIYGHLPHQLFIMMGCVVLGMSGPATNQTPR